jgi:HK97 gp10 family phage protein
MGRPRSTSMAGKRGSKIFIEAGALEGILKNMEHIDKYIKRVALADALEAGGEIILQAARAKAKRKSGHLANSLGLRKKIVLQKNAQYSYAVIGPLRSTEAVNSATQYAHFVEYGTAAHPIGSGDLTNETLLGRKGAVRKAQGANHPGARPQPFLRPAYDETKDRVIKVMGDILADGVERGSS